MKVYSIIAKESDLQEGPLRNILPAFTRKGKMMKAASKAATAAISDELRKMEVELLTYMEYSGQPRATPDVVKKYLKQKGLSSIGNEIVDRVSGTTAAADDAAAGADAAGLSRRTEPPLTNPNPPEATPEPSPVPPLPGVTRNDPVPPALPPEPEPTPAPTLARGTKVTDDAGVEWTFMGRMWRSAATGKFANRAKADELKQKATMQTNSINEASPKGLTKRQVRKIFKQVVQKAYAQRAGFGRSSFATDPDEPAAPIA